MLRISLPRVQISRVSWNPAKANIRYNRASSIATTRNLMVLLPQIGSTGASIEGINAAAEYLSTKIGFNVQVKVQNIQNVGKTCNGSTSASTSYQCGRLADNYWKHCISSLNPRRLPIRHLTTSQYLGPLTQVPCSSLTSSKQAFQLEVRGVSSPYSFVRKVLCTHI